MNKQKNVMYTHKKKKDRNKCAYRYYQIFWYRLQQKRARRWNFILFLGSQIFFFFFNKRCVYKRVQREKEERGGGLPTVHTFLLRLTTRVDISCNRNVWKKKTIRNRKEIKTRERFTTNRLVSHCDRLQTKKKKKENT